MEEKIFSCNQQSAVNVASAQRGKGFMEFDSERLVRIFEMETGKGCAAPLAAVDGWKVNGTNGCMQTRSGMAYRLLAPHPLSFCCWFWQPRPCAIVTPAAVAVAPAICLWTAGHVGRRDGYVLPLPLLEVLVPACVLAGTCQSCLQLERTVENLGRSCPTPSTSRT